MGEECRSVSILQSVMLINGAGNSVWRVDDVLVYAGVPAALERCESSITSATVVIRSTQFMSTILISSTAAVGLVVYCIINELYASSIIFFIRQQFCL